MLYMYLYVAYTLYANVCIKHACVYMMLRGLYICLCTYVVVVSLILSNTLNLASHPTAPIQVSGERDFFASMVVDAVFKLDPGMLDLKYIGTW